jgi:phosphoribosylformylglycinamidine synthase
MRQLVESVEGLGEACRAFETPITGGNVSLYNETLGEGIYPSPVVGIVGLMETARPLPVAFQKADEAIVLLGGVGATTEERFGSTQYAKVVMGKLWGLPPALDIEFEKAVQAAAREIARAGVVSSAHDLSCGGLGVALAESAMGGVGAQVDLATSLRPEFALFHEGPSRVLYSAGDAAAVQAIAARHGVPAVVIGRTGGDRLRINNWIDVALAELTAKWQHGLEELLHVR